MTEFYQGVEKPIISTCKNRGNNCFLCYDNGRSDDDCLFVIEMANQNACHFTEECRKKIDRSILDPATSRQRTGLLNSLAVKEPPIQPIECTYYNGKTGITKTQWSFLGKSYENRQAAFKAHIDWKKINTEKQSEANKL